MTQLDDLLNSLVTLLIRYHDSQPKIKKIISDTDHQQSRKKSRVYAINVLREDDINFKSFVTNLIKQSTSGYTGRSPFLSFILYEITFLKTLQSIKEPLDSQQLEEYKALITQLFIDFKKLLMTTKNKTCEVQYSRFSNEVVMNYERKMELSGLKKDTYIGNIFCNSGCLLNEEVLERFNILINSTDEELQLIAQNICEEYQNTLLIPELQTNFSAIKKHCNEQKTNIDSLTVQLQQTQSINKELKTRIKKLESTLSDYSNEITGYKETIAQLETSSSNDCTADYSSFFAVPSNKRGLERLDNKEKYLNNFMRE